MDRLIRERCLTIKEAKSVALQLARFYKNSLPVLLDGKEYVDRLRNDIELSHECLSDYRFKLCEELVEALYSFQMDYLSRETGLLAERAINGHIVDGHGDLRPEHICFEEGHDPVIYDCLQFSAELRAIDPLDELSFLTMEAERIGPCSLNPILFDTYAQVTGDCPPKSLLSFYTTYRAYLWARLAIWRTQELEQRMWSKWIERASEYLEIGIGSLAQTADGASLVRY
jgi:aminoglycoside phosphotransferase family enzyme